MDVSLALSLAVTPAATVSVPMPDTSPKSPLPVPSPSEEPRAIHHVDGMHTAGLSAEQSEDETGRWRKEASHQGKIDSQGSLDIATQGGSPAAEADFGAAPLLPETLRYELSVPKSSLTGVMNFSFAKQSNAGPVGTRQAADKGDATEQNSLGLMYLEGQDVEQIDVEAAKWFIKAANQGSPHGQTNLGVMYKNGRGVEQNDAEAVKWFTKAASQGDPSGQFNLGTMYEDGRGVEQNDVEAVR
ncbi:hypothetical protein DFQ27_001930, partial [Actinomortierella ambigua]